MKQTDIDAIKYRLIERGFKSDEIQDNTHLICATIEEAKNIYDKKDIVFSIGSISNALKKENNGTSIKNI